MLWVALDSVNFRARIGKTEMKEHRALIRTSYWVAAIADFIVAVLVLIPDRMGVSAFVYPMGLMSAVAFSWGVLLILADRKPMERKWVLLPTALVVFLLGVAGAYAAIIGILPVRRIAGSSTAVVIVLCLLIYTCFKTRAA
jgi:hypothetical protein